MNNINQLSSIFFLVLLISTNNALFASGSGQSQTGGGLRNGAASTTNSQVDGHHLLNPQFHYLHLRGSPDQQFSARQIEHPTVCEEHYRNDQHALEMCKQMLSTLGELESRHDPRLGKMLDTLAHDSPDGNLTKKIYLRKRKAKGTANTMP